MINDNTTTNLLGSVPRHSPHCPHVLDDQRVVDRLNSEVWATLRPSKIHGVGVFALRDIPAGTYLGRGQTEQTTYHAVSEESFMRILPAIRDMILDRTQQGDGSMLIFKHPNTMYKLQGFMNHSLENNSDGKVALRDIKEGEEITENFLTLSGKTNLHKLIVEHYKKEGIIK